jgi:hypothetical protein
MGRRKLLKLTQRKLVLSRKRKVNLLRPQKRVSQTQRRKRMRELNFNWLRLSYEFVLNILRNRYGAVTILALGWVTFISDIDLPFIIEEQIELNTMTREVKYISEKNDDLILKLIELDENPKVLERIARERYFMKKPLEEVYRIVD